MNSSKLKPLKIVHLAFCIAPVFFSLAAFLFVKDRLFFNLSTDQNDPYYPFFPLFAFMSAAVGFILFKKRLSALDPAMPADEKFIQYQSSFIIRCAFLESGALLNIVAFFQNGNAAFIIAAAIVIILLAATRPSKQNITSDLNLHYPDTEKL